PQGLKVKADEVRSLVGLSNPEDGDDVIGGRAAQSSDFSDLLNSEKRIALNTAENTTVNDSVDDLVEDNDNGFIAVSDEIASVIEKAADASTDFESFQKELEKLVTGWKPDKIAECIAVATFKARALGSAEFEKV
ncbi:MAG: DUF935 family protein, partial [Treponema sp.]|nr:DUF935 family protein [Treponema sp.]